MLQLRPITESIGTEVYGLDLSSPVSRLTFDRIYEALLETTVLLFRNQRMSTAQQVAFTKMFGEIVAYYDPTENPHPEQPEILRLSNVKADGTLTGKHSSAYLWHVDGHYLEEPPSGSVLYALEVPPVAGDTWFANMFAAYEALPKRTREYLDGKKIVISRVQSRPYNFPNKPPVTDEQRAAWPDRVHPLVRTHPATGRKALFIGSNVPWRIEGVEESESAPLVNELQQFAVQPAFTYKHVWQAGDVVMWDNASSMHRATPYDTTNHRRVMHRTTIKGGVPA